MYAQKFPYHFEYLKHVLNIVASIFKHTFIIHFPVSMHHNISEADHCTISLRDSKDMSSLANMSNEQVSIHWLRRVSSLQKMSLPSEVFIHESARICTNLSSWPDRPGVLEKAIKNTLTGLTGSNGFLLSARMPDACGQGNQLLTQCIKPSAIAERRLAPSWRASGTPRIDPVNPVNPV